MYGHGMTNAANTQTSGIITCTIATCPSNAIDTWKAPVRLWDCTSGTRTEIRCTDHAVDRELAGWTVRRIRTDDDTIADAKYAGVGVN